MSIASRDGRGVVEVVVALYMPERRARDMFWGRVVKKVLVMLVCCMRKSHMSRVCSKEDTPQQQLTTVLRAGGGCAGPSLTPPGPAAAGCVGNHTAPLVARRLLT